MNKLFAGSLTAVAVVSTLAATTSVATARQERTYGYCQVSEPHYGRYYVFSSVFTVRAGTYHVGVQNSYLSHVQAFFGRPVSSTICGVNYDSWQEAEDARNEHMARLRSQGVELVFTNWSYGGDE